MCHMLLRAAPGVENSSGSSITSLQGVGPSQRWLYMKAVQSLRSREIFVWKLLATSSCWLTSHYMTFPSREIKGWKCLPLWKNCKRPWLREGGRHPPSRWGDLRCLNAPRFNNTMLSAGYFQWILAWRHSPRWLEVEPTGASHWSREVSTEPYIVPAVGTCELHR